MRIDDCLEKGLIKRDSRASERVESSLKTDEKFLHSAERNLEIEEHEMAEIAAYNSAFHSARALLFSKGYVERSHYCLGAALRDLYRGRIIDLLKTFDKIRLSRHNVQYGVSLVDREEAEFVIQFASEFLDAAKTELLGASK